MENLLALVEKVQQISPLPIFSKETFVVQNAGMQHWLNMSLADKRGISINVDYALPAQFLWGIVRTLVNNGKEVEQAPFSREAMCWRVYQLLAEKRVREDEVFRPVTQYWQDSNEGRYKGDSKECFSKEENLKRYQLACQLADLFEQYLVFRPDWIDCWQSGNYIQNSLNELESKNLQPNFNSMEEWQAKLWFLLVEHQDYNPIKLLELAKHNLESYRHVIPKRLCFFGINAMAPMWLSFINALSEITEVHFFHLNPCVDYWGDILSEKQAIKNSDKWTQKHQLMNDSVGNPLLANLGQQGREFLVLLQQYSMVNIEAFESAINYENNSQPTILSKLQDDILTLTDARTGSSTVNDDSIVITSAHSALREVQGLHDWLLHQFNDDNELTPKDVLVMCPQVEQYAPYVNAVFARGWQDLDNDIPPLPCSIADRISKDSEPLVAAFSELLTLPDSRFQVSQILAWLRLPAMQKKFDLQIEDIEKFTIWIEQACIHWGLNSSHKKQVLKTEDESEQFTWQYGLSRLLQGFAFSEQEVVYEDKFLLPNIEGNEAILLGKLMLVVEQLQYYSQQLNTARTPQSWYQFLQTLINDIFDVGSDENFKNVFAAIESFVEYCQHASFEQKIDLNILREFLNNHFSQPEPGRQFMVGQVTFCSMLPMRSIPFKIVAVLGLNDGEFPRQRAPLGFDLMSLSQSRIGDRSRRGDDRYLFLEAIISARKSLYLSYQGRSIKNNNERQPSIVLKELMDYLSQAYQWKLLGDDTHDIRQLAMQPYSDKNYLGKYAGFDNKWLALSPAYQLQSIGGSEYLNLSEYEEASVNKNAHQQKNQETDYYNLSLQSNDLVRFFVHPSRYFAQKKLSLYLDNVTDQLEDVEPFESDHLSRYIFKEKALNLLLNENVEKENSEQTRKSLVNALKQQAVLSGKFPQLPNQNEHIDKLIDDSIGLAEFIEQNILNSIEQVDVLTSLELEVDIKGITKRYHIEVTSSLQFATKHIISYRSSLPKMKDFIGLYINLLIVQVWLEKNHEPTLLNNSLHEKLSQLESSQGYYFDSKNQKTVQYAYQKIDDAQQKLIELIKVYLLGQEQALLLNGDLAQVYFKAKVFEQVNFDNYWHDDNNRTAFGNDPYLKFFWPNCPDFESIQSTIEHVYSSIINECHQVKL